MLSSLIFPSSGLTGELLAFLCWRDVKLRYKQTVLGGAWAILQPLMTMIVFSIFFARLAHVSSGGIPTPVRVRGPPPLDLLRQRDHGGRAKRGRERTADHQGLFPETDCPVLRRRGWAHRFRGGLRDAWRFDALLRSDPISRDLAGSRFGIWSLGGGRRNRIAAGGLECGLPRLPLRHSVHGATLDVCHAHRLHGCELVGDGSLGLALAAQPCLWADR